ncbi:MAG: hypothetical protein ABEJ03_02650 [Candidatus Nanohaloarchaea archaeon]
MEQNLSDRERKIRLAIGLLLAAGSGAAFIQTENLYLAVGLGVASAGFIANYFTCFCGTKKAINKLRE